VGEVAARFNRNWSTRGSVLWDPHEDNNVLQLGAISLNYRGDEGGVLNIGHRYRRGLIEQTDLSFRMPITDQLSAVGRMYHSWRENHAIDSFAGLEYSSCCWAIRAIARDFVSEVDGDRNASFMVQFEMKGLTSIGDDVDRYIETGILGY
jgi:LPS-assembly protein